MTKALNLHIILYRLTFLLLFAIPFSVAAQQIDPRDYQIDTAGQVDLIDVATNGLDFSPRPAPREKKVYVSVVPASADVPGGGTAFLTSTKAGFFLGNKKNTYLSNVTLDPYFDFKGRYSVGLLSNLYTSKNRWNIQGETRFSIFPEYIYGTPKTYNPDEKLLIKYRYVRFYQTVLKRVTPYFLAGVGYNLDYHAGIRPVEDQRDISAFTGHNFGTTTDQNSVSSGITLNLLYDTRYNAINPLPGAYANIIFRTNPSFLGNGNAWRSVYADARRYRSLEGDKRKMIALWSYVWTALDNNVPYLDLPSIGAEPYQRSGRGTEMNRWRGKSLVYFESEYRSDITYNGLLGYVLFINASTNTGPHDNIFTGLHPAAGGGLRIKFNKRSATNIAIDFGVSHKNSTFTINLGEAF